MPAVQTRRQPRSVPLPAKRPNGFAYRPVERLWPGSTIVCVATGPSLTPEDVAYCQDKARIIAINDAYRYAPFADVFYGADGKWWKQHNDLMPFPGVKYSLTENSGKGVHVLRRSPGTGLELDPRGLKLGRNSGYQAINLAVHLGAARILLLGYTMQIIDGKSHFFGEHWDKSRSPYSTFIEQFQHLVKPLASLQIEVINCTPNTKLLCFPQAPLREVLT
jgi:hypothetical protein